MHFPWLECSILIPFLGAALCGLLQDVEIARKRAIQFSAVTLFCALGEWVDFGTLNSFAAHDHWDVFVLLLHRDVFVIDELSAPLVPVTALMYLLTIVSTLRTKASRFSFGLTLLSESLTLATLSCREPWVMIALLSLAIIPPWIELRRRQRCTRVYLLHMGLYVVLLVSGWSLVDHSNTTQGAPLLASALLTMAALLRAGVVPLHPWLTDLFENATFGTALLFVTPMTGAYAVMRLVLPVAPAWAMQSIAILSLITAVYAAGMSLVQTDARRFFCYLFLSHSSLVLVGLEIVTPIGMTGALCVWLSVVLSLGGFGLTMRSVEARIGRISLNQFHGLYEHMPVLASLFLLMGLSSIGFPGTLGFVGMELLIEGTVEVYPLVGTALVLAAALNGIAILKAYFRIFTGSRHVATVSLSARPSERFGKVLLSILILGGGLWPQPGVHSRYHAATALLRLRTPDTDGRHRSTAQHPDAPGALNLWLNPSPSTVAGDGAEGPLKPDSVPEHSSKDPHNAHP
jgi:NADH-quinone oxidoreductase subunit M